MQFDQERPRLGHQGGLAARTQGFLLKAVTAVATGVVLVGAIAMSVVVFAIALIVFLGFGTYLWWKLRQARRQAPVRYERSNVIDGVAFHEVKQEDRSRTER
ncbi:putative iron-regulated membrane protein [Povalibacter uvarum]|uniref:Putative iron-regulated membrane protein n=1 Tax=Povalibacter uvarum TaxID=732238 RepID=A0A841HTQ3_9GAMM|nr:hypothetical protein [Povalibacter uvarum]MBB6095590.1 putative iron-regulated membrane protein [Povalibacter uvarum]